VNTGPATDPPPQPISDPRVPCHKDDHGQLGHAVILKGASRLLPHAVGSRQVAEHGRGYRARKLMAFVRRVAGRIKGKSAMPTTTRRIPRRPYTATLGETFFRWQIEPLADYLGKVTAGNRARTTCW